MFAKDEKKRKRPMNATGGYHSAGVWKRRDTNKRTSTNVHDLLKSVYIFFLLRPRKKYDYIFMAPLRLFNISNNDIFPLMWFPS